MGPSSLGIVWILFLVCLNLIDMTHLIFGFRFLGNFLYAHFFLFYVILFFRYVRKTAAVCVAKLYDINAQLVEDQGFLDQLKDLLSDSNPMVVANAVAALSEMNEASTSGVALIEMNAQTINKLLTALNECTEWGQVSFGLI